MRATAKTTIESRTGVMVPQSGERRLAVEALVVVRPVLARPPPVRVHIAPSRNAFTFLSRNQHQKPDINLCKPYLHLPNLPCYVKSLGKSKYQQQSKRNFQYRTESAAISLEEIKANSEKCGRSSIKGERHGRRRLARDAGVDPKIGHLPSRPGVVRGRCDAISRDKVKGFSYCARNKCLRSFWRYIHAGGR